MEDRGHEMPATHAGDVSERAIRTDAIRAERHRLSHELHDGLAQHLVSLGYLLDNLRAFDDPAALATAIDGARHQVGRIRAELREMIGDLRADDGGILDAPPVSPPSGALVDHARRTARHGGLDARLDMLTAAPLAADIAAEFVHIGREAITNAGRHAAAHTLWVSFMVGPSTARLTVADDGVGLRDPAARTGGNGLAIMAERAERIGARFRIDDRAGGGTVVTVSTGEERGGDPSHIGGTGRRP